MSEGNKSSYVVMGHINLHKSNVCGTDFVKYLSDLYPSFRLNRNGHVLGMEKYGYNSREARKKYSLPGKDYIDPVDANAVDNRTLARPPVQRTWSSLFNMDLEEALSQDAGRFNTPHNKSKNKPNNKKGTKPNPRAQATESQWSDLFNIELNQALDPSFPFGIDPNLSHSEDEVIHLNGERINLSSLPPQEKADTIREWQSVNFPGNFEEASPSGFIFGIQEPWFFRNSLGSLRGSHVIFDRSVDTVKAAIVASRNLNLWQDPNFCSSSMATAQWNSGTKFGTIYIVSLYCENPPPEEGLREETVPKLLIKLVRKCRRESKHYIILADTNAWSQLWNSPRQNRRGNEFEEFIHDYNVCVLNVGNDWTYYKSDDSQVIRSIIDVSFCSPGIETLVSNWQVRDAVPSSDHASIEFCFHTGDPEVYGKSIEVFDFKKMKIQAFQSKMEELSSIPLEGECDKVWNFEKLVAEVKKLYEDIYQVLNEECPKKVIDLKKQVNHLENWWNNECRKHQKKVRMIKSYLRRLKDKPLHSWESPNFTHSDLVEAKRLYRSAISRAKKASWRKFLESAVSMEQLGRLNRALKPKTDAELCLFKNRNGTSMSPEETLNTLCEEHFPGCRNEVDRQPYEELHKTYSSTLTCNITDSEAHFISMEKLITSIKSFGNFKAPGSDGLCPFVYKQLGPLALQRLLQIYKASYLLGITPQIWRDVKVIFIPKVGKTDFSDPRSFRPISLMQFMYKILEKLLLWEQEGPNGLQLHENQHGFRKGRSCESTLTSFVGCIEKGLQNKHYTVALFVDIKGAFDNIKNENIVNAMKAKGCKNRYIKWCQDFLYNRNIVVDFKGVTIKRFPIMGAPQGGVSSPWMWNIIVDDLHNRIGQMEIPRSEGFADDTVLLATHRLLGPAIKHVQDAIAVLEQWLEEQSLELSVQKSKAIIFSRRNKLRVRKQTPPKLKLLGQEIDYSSQHKNLGILFDKKLTFIPHVKQRMAKAKGMLIKLSTAMGKLYGLKPMSALWMYKAVARPMLSYGCLVWHKVCDQKSIRDKLRSFQRQGLKQLGFFRKSTPTAGLELITFTKPLPLHLREQAALSYIRTRGFEKFPENEMIANTVELSGHRYQIRQFMHSIGADFTDVNLDDITRKYIWERLYKVDQESMDPKNKRKYGIPKCDSDCNIYTDGSKQADGFAGAGMTVWKVLPKYGATTEFPYQDFQYHLEKSTIAQCEMYAINKAATWLVSHAAQHKFKSAVINTDSYSSIQALQNKEVKSKLVEDTVHKVNMAASIVSLTIRWNKAHEEEHRGNDRADKLANQGAKEFEEGQPVFLVEDVPKLPFSTVKSELLAKVKSLWEFQWTHNVDTKWDHRQTKDWFPATCARFSFQLLKNSSRIMFSKKVHVITGHGFFNDHEYTVNPSDDGPGPLCDRCDADVRQTAKHIFQECDAFAHLRLLVFKDPYPRDFSEITDAQLTRFIDEINIQWFPFEDPDAMADL